MSFSDQIRDKYRMASVLERMIVINIIVFMLFAILKTGAALFNITGIDIGKWLAVTHRPEDLLSKPWSLITYAFLHDGFWHLVFNMLILYFAGRYFLSYLTTRQFLSCYFMGVLAGAGAYILSYNFFPAFADISRSQMVGASAAVMAILVGVATYIPYMGVRLLLIGRIKLWHIAVFFVILDIVRIPMGNAGGYLAHLGGAMLGFVYARQLKKGNNIGGWMERIIGSVAAWFQPKKPLRTAYKKPNRKHRQTRRSEPMRKGEQQKKIDGILDKISKSGYESLSREEKDFLFRAGKDQ